MATSGNTFDCLRNATSDDIQTGLLTALSKVTENFAFDPTIDGPGGLYPDLPSKLFRQGEFARIPFITGTNLDEGALLSFATIYPRAVD